LGLLKSPVPGISAAEFRGAGFDLTTSRFRQHVAPAPDDIANATEAILARLIRGGRPSVVFLEPFPPAVFMSVGQSIDVFVFKNRL
jgi:hypothetical protein